MTNDLPRGSRLSQWAPWLLIALAAIVRIVAVAVWTAHLGDDRDDYWTVAHSYLEHGFWAPFTRFPNSFRPPLLPLVLVLLLKMGWGTIALGVLQVILGTASVALTLAAGKRLGLGRLSLVAGGLVACDPLLIAYTTFPMTETLFTFLVIALVTVTIPDLDAVRSSRHVASSIGRAALAGLLFGACALCRPTIWPTAGLGAAWIVWESVRTRRLPRSLIASTVVACLTCALVVAPWALRNWEILGSPVITTTHGGYTLLLGNNPEFFRHLAERPLPEVWSDREPDQFQQAWLAQLIARKDQELGYGVDELVQNRWMYQQAWKSISAQPGLFVRACALRFVLFWNAMPLLPSRSSLARPVVWALCAGYVVELALFILGLATLVRRGDRRWVFPVCVILNFTLVHLVYWSNMRMRAPLVPLIALIAARGLSAWINRRKVNKFVAAREPQNRP
ncbi:MAG TPA: hypothetical protein VGP63_10920 [Planctomycetaceae bacterium]|nr:hypothetical protein [Planctomycetaceae bacterium]